MMSYRFVAVVCVLVALALVPTLLHSYTDSAADDGRRAAMIDDVLDGYVSVPSQRNATWGQRRFGSDDWVEREYVDATTGKKLRLTVVRALDAKTVYHHPELAVIYGTSFVGADVKRFPERPEIPVYVLEPGAGVSAGAMYVLHHGADFVEDPIAFQLKNAITLLFSRRQPMTLFFLFEADSRSSGSESARRLLFAAIDGFLRAGSTTLGGAGETR